MNKKELDNFQILLHNYYKKFTKLELFHFVLVLLNRFSSEKIEDILKDVLEIAKERRKLK